MQLPQHGSNPQYVYQKMGIQQPNRYIDLSANINPLGPPSSIERNWMMFFEQLNDYPDPYASKLKEMIASREKVETESIAIGNGGAELIFLIARVLAEKNVLIIEPTFSEYEKACKANACNIHYHYTKEPDWELQVNGIDEKLQDIDAVFLCNPNNPTGVYYPYHTIVDLLEACREADTLLIIDEAFYDFVKDYEKISVLLHQYTNLVILRSMTKMFAIPGIRLGYALAHPSIISKMLTYQPHWSVNALAMAAGQLCLEDNKFVEQSVQYIQSEREKIFSCLETKGFVFSPSQVNFYLMRDPKQESILSLFSFLLNKGIVPRHTFNFPGLEGTWLRFAIKRTDENKQLLEALNEWKQLL